MSDEIVIEVESSTQSPHEGSDNAHEGSDNEWTTAKLTRRN
jgi:hypothetical protein